MKLNKKGFGVAEMAIVILLIGILAAAVIVGFLGIKKNATEHVDDEMSRSIEIIHQTKHAYPTILSGDTKSIRIKSGEYEVYEMGGYDILAGGDGITVEIALHEKHLLYMYSNTPRGCGIIVAQPLTRCQQKTPPEKPLGRRFAQAALCRPSWG